jgi:WD40 repeat protein/serine/threonine protein kinase
MTEREIFFEALEMTTPEARAAYLQGACGWDVTLRRKVDELLKEHYSNDSLLAGPALEGERGTMVVSPIQEFPAQMIGRYTLLEKVGEGGFGEVWMAEQREPVKRRVALKIIKLGMDSRQIVARFEAERQALAMMDHPNIAKIFDAGTTETPHPASGHPLASDGKGAGGEGVLQSEIGNRKSEISQGRPYFVMELVRGIKITEFCDQNQLPTRERLRLFILVCQAIQHAHQKGIIHRDIKPSNILVTLHDGVPVPKVIDFGIAKATQQELTDKTVFTLLQQFIGTPAYISPEQAEMSGLDIDTRADIYSLGVLLYELLVGQTPFDAKEMMQGGLDALRQIIREKEPLRPSTKLSQTLVAADPRRLSSQSKIANCKSQIDAASSRRLLQLKETIALLRGDLDWIVMKCLEKDRTRRYDTANGLAMDIQRHLANEPVVARPPSAAYRFQKAWQRNKLVFTAGAAVVVALVVGSGVSTWQAIRATRAEREQNRQREAAVKASASEAVQRKLADTQRDVAVEQRKLADMQLALQAWEEGDLQRANDLIDASRPAPGEAPAFEWRYLMRLCQDESHETLGGTNHPYRSALFFDRDWLLLNDQRTLTLHDLSGRRNQLLLEDQDGIRRSTFCFGNTNLLATVTDATRIKVWDLAARRVMVEFEGHSRTPIISITFSRDGKWLASASSGNSASSDNSVKLWDVESRNPQPVRTLRRYSYGARGVAFSPDGRQLFSSGTESMIRVWDVATGSEAAAPLEGHAAWGGPLVTAPDGLSMASGAGDSTVIIWNVFSRNLERRLLGHSAPIHALAYSPDGRILASAGRDHTIRLWDMKTSQQLSLLRGHGSFADSLGFSPDGQWLVSRSRDGLVKLWSVTASLQGSALTGSPEWLQDVALSPDGRYLASAASGSSVVNLWELATRSRTLLHGHSSETVMCAVFSPDGKILATGGHDQTVRLWDVNNHKAIATLTNGFPVGSLAFSPDGRTLIVGGSSFYFLEGDRAGLQFWDVPSQQATGTIPGDASDIVDLALSASGSLLATGHKDGAVSLWDAQTRRLGHRFESQFGRQVISLSFSPAEPLLAASDLDGNIVLYNTTTMEVVRPPLKAHTKRVIALAFSPDGRTLASAGEGGGLKLWNVATRQVALTLKGHVGSVCGIAFSRDGNFLASCGADATVRFWPAAALPEAGGATKTRTQNQ